MIAAYARGSTLRAYTATSVDTTRPVKAMDETTTRGRTARRFGAPSQGGPLPAPAALPDILRAAKFGKSDRIFSWENRFGIG